jgi:hypothetical protein
MPTASWRPTSTLEVSEPTLKHVSLSGMATDTTAPAIQSFFSVSADGTLMPHPLAVSPWSSRQVGGYAVCGVLARAIEHAADSQDFVPVRLTVDLCAPVGLDCISATAAAVRRGPRIEVLEASLGTEPGITARASAVFAALGTDPPGDLWHDGEPLPTPPDCDDQPSPPLFSSTGGSWNGDFAAHQNSNRKTAWQNFPPLVAGEEMSPFVRAAVMAETTSLVCHWGTAGAGFINIDTTLALSRLPRGTGLGLRADNQRSHAGISVGTATMFDRDGYVGSCTVTAISNARRQVDLGALRPD